MKIIQFFIFGILLGETCAFSTKYTEKPGVLTNQASGLSLKLPNIKEIGSLNWVQEKIKKMPELLWLLDENVQHTQEGKSQQRPESWSPQLKGALYPEFERTILSIKNLYLILNGTEEAYHKLCDIQKDVERLSFDSFRSLHNFARSVVKNDPERLKALEVNLVMGDMGKTSIARLKAADFKITEPDHDLFLDECLEKYPHLFETFTNLPPETQKNIKNMTGLIHFGHFTHVEGGPEILKKLKKSGVLETAPENFDFEILTHICDVSAARGHENNQGSLVLTENTFKTLQLIKETIHYLSTHTEEETLQYYLDHRAEWLGLNNMDKKKRNILARMGSMLRLFSVNDGKSLLSGYQLLPQAVQKIFEEEFNPTLYRQERTATYIPAVLVNAQSSFIEKGLTRDVAIQECLSKIIPLLGTILRDYRSGNATISYNPGLTLNFNKVAGQIRDKINLINQASYRINKDGMIELIFLDKALK